MLNPNFFFAYLLLAIVVTVLAVRMSKAKWAKWVLGVSLPLVFWAFGHIDDFLGEIEHKKLCAKEAGVKTYRKAKLPRHLFGSNGEPQFLKADGADEQMLADYVQFETIWERAVWGTHLPIDKRYFRIRDAKTGQILGEVVDFNLPHSRFVPRIGQGGGRDCPEYIGENGGDQYRRLYRLVLTANSAAN